MKKILSYSGFFLLLAFIFISCGPTAAEKEEARKRRSKTPNPITWDTIAVNKNQPLDSPNVKASCSLKIDFIVPKEYEKIEIIEKIRESINYVVMADDDSYIKLEPSEAVQKYVTDYINGYKAEVKSQLPLWNKMNGGTIFSYDKTIRTEVLYNEANLISYQVRTTESKGDSDSTATVIVRNILLDLNNGNQLTENDIFEEGYKEKLNEILIKQILKDKKVKNLEELQELGYWGVADLATNNNFYVTRDGVTYTFNPDEYADAELGVLKVFIDFDDLDNLLKENSPISILVND